MSELHGSASGAGATLRHGRLIVISAVSGAGKTTLQRQVLPRFPSIGYSISTTTRPPRVGELDGVHYFFRTREQFQKMIAEDALIEWMEVHGNFYGTPKAYVEQTLAQGKHVLLDLDVKGKVNFDHKYPDAVGIFITVPDMGILEQRLRARATDAPEVIELRLRNAREELAFAQSRGKYEHWLVNDDLTRAVADLTLLLAGILGEEPLDATDPPPGARSA